MTYDLKFIARQLAAMNGRRGRYSRPGIRVRGISLPRTFERELYVLATSIVDYWDREAQLILLPTYERAIAESRLTTDAGTDNLSGEIAGASEGAQRLALELTPALRSWVVRVEQWHRGRWVSAVRDAIGYDVNALVANLSAHDEVRSFEQWAAGLIRDISQSARRRIEAEVYQAYANQTPRRVLAKEIAGVIKSSRKRALFIARDQANKISGKMDELRQREAGISQYRWRTARDDRVRPTHAANEGKIFSWKKPPVVTGHPRTEPNCRCTAEPYIPLLAEAEQAVARRR